MVGTTPREAEVAAENYLRARGAVECRRPVRTKWQRVDFFGADVLAVLPDGRKIWCQVTTAQRTETVRRRRRRLEAVPWNPFDIVVLFEEEERPNPVNAHRIDRFFRVHEYHPAPDRNRGAWEIWPDPIPITPEMLRVRKAELATTKDPE